MDKYSHINSSLDYAAYLRMNITSNGEQTIVWIRNEETTSVRAKIVLWNAKHVVRILLICISVAYSRKDDLVV